MKKFMKACAIIALVLVLTGLILGIVGSTTKGSSAISRVVENVTGGKVKIGTKPWDWGITVSDGFFDSLDEVLDSVIDDALLFSESGSGTVVDVLDIIRSGRSDVLRENETVLPACQRIADSDKYHHLFMDVSVSDHIIQRIAAHDHDKVVPDLMAHTGLATDEADMLFKFILNGSFAVNRSLSWEKNERWYRFQQILGRFINAGIEG